MTQITPPPSDDDLPDERELAALYARLPKVEPDASLDAAVLAAATRAMPVHRRPLWPVALASAAVLVLAVGVAWQVREVPPTSSGFPRAALPAPEAAPAPVAPAVQEAKGIAAEAAPTENLRKAARAPKKDAGVITVGAASAAMPRPHVQIHRLTAPALAPAPAPMAPAPAAPAPAPEPVAAAAPPEPPKPPAPPVAEAADAPVVSAAPSPAQLQVETARPQMVQPAPSGMLREKSFAPASAAANIPVGLAPDDRVGEIRRLLGRGERAQALRELKDLRQRYPHYDLPQDLRDLNP